MSRITHTIQPRLAQAEADAKIANVSVTVAGAVISFSGTGLSTLTATVTNPNGSPGATATASAISGNAATVTIAGTPVFGDDVKVVLNGETKHVGWEGDPAMSAANARQEIAAAMAGRINAEIKGDYLSYLGADKAAVTTTVAAGSAGGNCLTSGLRYTQLVDGRATTSSAGGSFPTSGSQTIVNDSETTS